MSMARPRLMCAGWTRVGFPSVSSYDAFISGSVFSAFTSAQPIRWVKDTLPPRARLRWLLMTIRLSISSLTGTCRTLVAVGTERLASMFCAVRAGAPRRISRSESVLGWAVGAGVAGGGWFTAPPVGLLLPFGSALAVDDAGWAAGCATGLA